MASELLVALGLALVLEGILPFASPRTYRSAVAQMALSSDNVLRGTGFGFGFMLVGLMVVTLAR